MRTILVAAAMAAAVLNPAPVLAQGGVPPDLSQIESLCPDIGTTGIAIGQMRDGAGSGALADLDDKARLAGFDDAEPVFTHWSNRLAAIEYHLAVNEDQSLEVLREALIRQFDDAGWQRSEPAESAISLGFDVLAYRRPVASGGGEAALVVEFDTAGVLALRCGDPDLLALNDRELQGELEPGSPRPVPPLIVPARGAWLAGLDCDDPQIVARFAEAGNAETAGALAEELTGDDYSSASRYEQRLRTWLQWTLLSSGKVTQDELWQIEEDTSPLETGAMEEELLALLDTGGDIFGALDAGDPEKLCKGYRLALESFERSEQQDSDRAALVNRALQQLALERGIDIE